MAFQRNRLLPSDYMLSGTLGLRKIRAARCSTASQAAGSQRSRSSLPGRHRERSTRSCFNFAGQRSVAEIAAELARKLKLGFETRREEHIAAIKAWLAERRLCWCWTTSGKARWKRWCPVLRSRCSARRAGIRFRGSRRLIRCCTRNRKRSAWSWAIGRSL